MTYCFISVVIINIIIIVLNIKKDNKKNIYLVIAFDIALALAILSYMWIPSEEYDLYRYYSWMDNMQNLKGSKLINYLYTSRGEPLTMTYFYIISKTNNYSLLQFFPTLIVYFIIFYMIIDYVTEKKYNRTMILIMCLLFVSLYKFILLPSGIRSTFGLTLFSLGLYLEYIKRNKKWYIKLLYILSLTIHNGTIILLLIRILLSFIHKLDIKKVIGLCAIYLIIIILLPYILQYVTFNVEFLDTIKQKIIFYFKIDILENLSLQFIFRTVQLILTFAILYIIDREKIFIDNSYMEKYNLFYKVLCCFCLLNFFFYSIWIRYLDMLLIGILPIMIEYLINSKNIKLKKFVYLAMAILIIGGIRIQIPIFARMNFKI